MRVLAVVALLVLAGCGGSDEAKPTTTLVVEVRPDPAPSFYPVMQGSVPGWLERIKPAEGLGRWQSAQLLPDGKTLLAQ